jgi:hypothetical protein
MYFIDKPVYAEPKIHKVGKEAYIKSLVKLSPHVLSRKEWQEY